MITRMPTFGQFVSESENISKQLERLSEVMQQSDTGKKLIHSSDDPVLAAQIKGKQNYISTLTAYGDNGALAQGRASMVNASAQSVTNVVSQISTMVKQAQTGTLSNNDRASLGKQMQGLLTHLTSVINTQDASGQYIFSGSNGTTQPFSLVNGSYQYHGADPSYINIAPGLSTIYGESGSDAFANICIGNGTFTVTAPNTNSGTAYTSPGTVNTANYVPDTYTISFGTNTNGALVYKVMGTTSGQVIPALPATFPNQAPVFEADANINFNGVTLAISGQPNVADTFQISPSPRQNVLNTVQNVIDLLETPASNTGQFNQSINQLSESIIQVSTHVTAYLSEVGSRSATINTQLTDNKNILSQQSETLSNLEDADLPTLYSALSQQSLALQVTQASYMKMQDLFTRLLQLPM